MISSEYGFTIKEFRSHTMREISQMVNAIIKRKCGSPKGELPPATPEGMKKILSAASRRSRMGAKK